MNIKYLKSISVACFAVAMTMAGCTGSSSNDGDKDTTVTEEDKPVKFESQFSLKSYTYEDSCDYASVKYIIQVPINNSDIATKIREAIYDETVSYTSRICNKRINKYNSNNLVDIAQYCGSQALDYISAETETDYLTRLAEERENGADVPEDDSFVDLLPSTSELEINLIYETKKIAVFESNEYSYRGGAHGAYMTSSITFDLNKGTIVRNFLKDDAEKDIQQLLFDGVSSYFQKYEDEFKNADLMDYLLIDTSTIPLPQNSLTPEANGLRFRYSCYEIASYAAGEINFLIPYSKIKPYMTKEAKKLIE